MKRLLLIFAVVALFAFFASNASADHRRVWRHRHHHVPHHHHHVHSYGYFHPRPYVGHGYYSGYYVPNYRSFSPYGYHHYYGHHHHHHHGGIGIHTGRLSFFIGF